FELQTCGSAASIAGGANARIRNKSLAVLVTRAINKLNPARRKSGFFRRRLSFLRQQQRRTGMRSIRLGNDRVSGGDRGGKIAAGNAIERQRKIVRAENDHRPNRAINRPDVVLL